MMTRATAFILLACFLIPASGLELAVILGERNEAGEEFVSQLRKSLANSEWRISAVTTADELPGNPAVLPAKLWITLGVDATRAALAAKKARPVYAALLSHATFVRLQQENALRRPSIPLGGLVLDQPVEISLRLIQILMPDKKRLGVLVGEETRELGAKLAQLAARFEMALEIEEASDTNLLAAANRLLARADIFFVVPESRLYSPHNLRPLLLAAYRFQRPVIGDSAAFVQAGALAAVFMTPTQSAAQIGKFLRTHRKPPSGPTFPEQFTLATNRQTAQALSIELPDESVLLRSLQNRRSAP